jgi:hypothetical protein
VSLVGLPRPPARESFRSSFSVGGSTECGDFIEIQEAIEIDSSAIFSQAFEGQNFRNVDLFTARRSFLVTRLPRQS